MKYNEVQNKDVRELNSLLKDERISLGKLRFELNNKSLRNPSMIKITRRNIAKILTATKNVERGK